MTAPAQLAADPRDLVVRCAVVLLGLLSARQIGPERSEAATIVVDRRALLELAAAVDRAAPGAVDAIRGRRSRRRGGAG